MMDAIKATCDAKLGTMPVAMMPWKSIAFSPKKNEMLTVIFNEMKSMDTMGAVMAKAYAKRSKEIGRKLVADKVAYSDEDVNTVLLTGFYHAYGPINNYLD